MTVPISILTPEEEEKVSKFYGINANNNSINVDINEDNADINSVFANESTQSKSKKEKKSKRIDKVDRFDISKLPFEPNYYVSCLVNDHLLSIYEPYIQEFNDFIEETIALWDKELFVRCFRYTRDQVNRSHSEIESVTAYFVISLQNNLEKMQGYDERMQKWCEEVDAYLKIINYDKVYK